MLIPLFLINKKILDKPLLYLSIFFEKYRSVYYEKLDKAREKNEFQEWLLFFLEGIERTAEFAIQNLNDILTLTDDLTEKINKRLKRRANNGVRLLKLIFKTPIISSSFIRKELKISSRTVSILLKDFCKLEILKNISQRKRNRRFIFSAYIDILTRDFNYE